MKNEQILSRNPSSMGPSFPRPSLLTIIHSVAFSHSLIMHESSNHKNSGRGFTMMNLRKEEAEKKAGTARKG
jgi:hypothetical protein